MNFSDSSDAQPNRSGKGRHISSAQQTHNIFGYQAELNQDVNDLMFPPNRRHLTAEEIETQKQRARDQYEKRMEDAMNNRKMSQQATHIFEAAPDVSKYSYKAQQQGQQNFKPISNVFQQEAEQQQQHMTQFKDNQAHMQSDVMNQQQQQEQEYRSVQTHNANRQQSDIFNTHEQQYMPQHVNKSQNRQQSDIFNQRETEPSQVMQHHYPNRQNQSNIFNQDDKVHHAKPLHESFQNSNRHHSNVFDDNDGQVIQRPTSKKVYQQTRQGFNPITGVDYNDAPVTARSDSARKGRTHAPVYTKNW